MTAPAPSHGRGQPGGVIPGASRHPAEFHAEMGRLAAIMQGFGQPFGSVLAAAQQQAATEALVAELDRLRAEAAALQAGLRSAAGSPECPEGPA